MRLPTCKRLATVQPSGGRRPKWPRREASRPREPAEGRSRKLPNNAVDS